MYNLDNVIKMYFSSVPVQGIVQGSISYENFSKREFAQLSWEHLPHYSDTEEQQLYDYIADGVREEGHPFAGMENRSGLNIFAALEELAEQLLIMEGNEVLCIYDNLLRLRQMTKYVEEDLLVCAYLAMYFKRFGKRCTDFGWNTTIGHNNMQLNKIMERGISENHFHLFGSAPAFHLLWIHFMNHVETPMLYNLAAKIEKNKRVVHQHYDRSYSEDSFVTKILKAALIRIHILLYLMTDNEGESENDREANYDVGALLSGKEDIAVYCNEIQTAIDQIRNQALLCDMGVLSDYALYAVDNIVNTDTERYWFAGERWIMYKMLEGELSGRAGEELSGKAERKSARRYYQWFYAYLVLKQHLRSEVVQLNDKVGFENFAIYSDRKSGYPDVEKMIEAAVYGSVENGNIRSLEIRISPKKLAYDNAMCVNNIDAVIEKREKNPFPKSNYYYVFHFSKAQDELLGEWESFDRHCCRHYKKRLELEQQAAAVYDFREKYRKAASRVLGIDACAQEIGCRPEVFAPIFRHLAKHVVEKVVGVDSEEVGQLKMSYHVGEDFLDVVDGLRAVDEAIHFLGLRYGDRIGHGTVLGIDVRKWYVFKQNAIVLKKQDYLDNIVWLYHKLAEYSLDDFHSLRAWLEHEFEFYFSEIYLRLEDGGIRDSIRSNIHTYYEAWKLRGDAPELYLDGYYDRGRLYGRDWLVNRSYPERFENRMRLETGYLYYLYHYDWNVRNSGEKSIQVQIPPMYVEGVCAVQRKVQRAFAALGIGIESNPSSNLAISTFGSYGEHPIVAMYNKDLTWDVEQMRECPQLYVSINTDDKGVFHTSLENEYALMACAMEEKKDEKGGHLYNRQMVYQWIDNIREMGNLQSFGDAVGDV